LYIFTSDNGIEQLKFLTKKGKELAVGEKGGQNAIKNYINNSLTLINKNIFFRFLFNNYIFI